MSKVIEITLREFLLLQKLLKDKFGCYCYKTDLSEDNLVVKMSANGKSLWGITEDNIDVVLKEANLPFKCTYCFGFDHDGDRLDTLTVHLEKIEL